MMKELKKQKLTDLQACAQEYGYEYPGDWKDALIEIEGNLTEFFDCLTYRDVTWIAHKGTTIYITGGMSWGDDPTDSYRTFERVAWLPLSVLTAGKLEEV